MRALEWADIDFAKRQLTVARSEWKGHVTMPKGGRLRYVPMTRRLTEALREARHLSGPRVLCDGTGKPLTQEVVQVLVPDRQKGECEAWDSHPSSHVLFSPGDARGPGTSYSGARRASGSDHDTAVHASQSRGARPRDPVA